MPGPEAEHRRGKPLSAAGLWLLYLPLLVPQVAFLPGVPSVFLVVVLPNVLAIAAGAWKLSGDVQSVRLALEQRLTRVETKVEHHDKVFERLLGNPVVGGN